MTEDRRKKLASNYSAYGLDAMEQSECLDAIAAQAAEIERLKAEIKRLQGECAAYENVATAAEHDRKVLRAELARLKPVGSGWSTADENVVRKALEESQSSRTPGIGAMTWMAFERLAAAARRDDANTLKPTGEVAKDVEILSKSIAWSDGCCGRPPCVDQGEDALSRLAAKAHGYEAMKAERDALKAESAARLALADMWKMRADTLEVERDAAVAANKAMREPMRLLREAMSMPAQSERAVVEALLKEKQAQAELVKMLGDALAEAEKAMSASPKFNAWDIGPLKPLEDVRAALRKAGRLP